MPLMLLLYASHTSSLKANVVLFAELSWTPGSIEQAENRVHRMGESFPASIISPYLFFSSIMLPATPNRIVFLKTTTIIKTKTKTKA